MVWRVVKAKLATVNSPFQHLKESFNAANLGNAKPEPRWLQCVGQVQANLGAALSNVYVKNQLTSADKEMVRLE